MHRRTFLTGCAGVCASTLILPFTASAAAVESDRLVMTLNSGQVTMLLLPDLAPVHVNRIKTLVRAGFYNGMPFSRVIEGFMAQTGDPVRETGVEHALLPRLNAEFHTLPFERGVVGMARSRSPHSACHQFFITSGRSRCLDQKYTAVGWVTSGMELIDQLPKGNPVTGKVAEPGIIKNMQIVRT